MPELASLVIFASDLEPVTAFYRALGIALDEENHDDGPVHAATDLGSVHFAVYQAEDGIGSEAATLRSASSTFPGFYVESLDAVTDALQDLGSPILEPHQVRPWGCRIIAADPDGRAIEVNQRAIAFRRRVRTCRVAGWRMRGFGVDQAPDQGGSK